MTNEVISNIKSSIEDFLYDEEGNITRNRVLTVGSMMLLMGLVFASDVFATHSSHRSHSSHSSHSSGSGGHSSHSSHESHSSHSSGSTHSSHSSSSGSGDYGTRSTPVQEDPLPTVGSLKTPPASDSLSFDGNIATEFTLPDTPKIVTYNE